MAAELPQFVARHTLREVNRGADWVANHCRFHCRDARFTSALPEELQGLVKADARGTVFFLLIMLEILSLFPLN